MSPSAAVKETATAGYAAAGSHLAKRLDFAVIYRQMTELAGLARDKLTAKQRWGLAIGTVLRVVHALNGATITAAELLERKSAENGHGTLAATAAPPTSTATTSDPGAVGGTAVAFRLSDFLARSSFKIDDVVRDVLNKPREHYTADDVALIEKVTSRMPAFAKYSAAVRKKLCGRMQYEVFGKGRVLIREGYEATSFYFILNGQVQVYKMENGAKVALNELGPGDSFGELALLRNSQRTASIACTMRSTFFRVDKDDFLEVLKSTAEEELTGKLAFFRTLPLLDDVPKAQLARLAEVGVRKEFGPNALVVREYEQLYAFSFVLSGSLRVVRLVPFIKQRQRYGRSVRSTLRPAPAAHDQVSQLSLRRDEVLVNKLLCIDYLMPGAYFGEECILASVERRRGGVVTSQSGSNNPSVNSTSTAATSAVTEARSSIITNERTVVLVVNKVDFLKAATEHTLQYLEEQEVLRDVPLSRIQEAFLTQREWLRSKQELVRQLVSEQHQLREQHLQDAAFNAGDIDNEAACHKEGRATWKH
ncbi:hypothetical protein RI367_005972 [Sorochytrium milnesiophthora]